MHDLEWAVRGADIVSAATMAREPLIRGAWLHPGQHLDLIGAFRPDMREADDEALLRHPFQEWRRCASRSDGGPPYP